MKGKEIKTATCEWIRTDPVLGEKCEVETEEEFLTYKTLK